MEARTGRARVADVAREAGVSKTAVSCAFNSPERLNPETAARIREVADALGYRPRPAARTRAGRKMMALTRSSTPPTAMPARRNGNKSNQTMG